LEFAVYSFAHIIPVRLSGSLGKEITNLLELVYIVQKYPEILGVALLPLLVRQHQPKSFWNSGVWVGNNVDECGDIRKVARPKILNLLGAPRKIRSLERRKLTQMFNGFVA